MTPLPAALQALRPVRFAATGAAHSQNSFRRCLIPEGAPHYACIAAPAVSKPGLAAQSNSIPPLLEVHGVSTVRRCANTVSLSITAASRPALTRRGSGL